MAGDAGNVTSYNSCANYGNVTGKEATAGIHRTAAGSGITITNCYSEGTFTTISTTSSAGLVVGWIKNGATLKNCVGTGSIALYGGSSGTGNTLTNNQKFDKDALDMAAALDILNADLETSVWVAGTNAPELSTFYVAPEVTIDGASLTIGNSVTLNMFVYKKTLEAAGVSSLQSIHIRDSASENYQGKLVDDKYVFQIKGLTANDFGTARSYTVQYVTNDNMVVVSKAVKEYSPLQYAINMYGKRADMEKLDPLLLAIVNYAEAAGATGAKEAFKAKHADADWTKLPAYETVLAGDTNAAQYTYKTLQTEKGLPALNTTALDDRLILSVYLWDCDYTKVSVKIGNVDAGDITGFPSVEFYPTDLYNTIEFTFAKDEGDPVVATWSIMQYLDSYKGTPGEVFAQATAIYLYAVRTFCLVNQTTD